MKKASVDSVYRLISAISTGRDKETIAQLKQTREEVAMQRAELEEKQSEQQTLLYEQRAQQAKLTQALNERKRRWQGWSLPSSKVSNS